MRAPIILAALLALASQAHAATPVGEWRTIDDATHTPKAVVKIFEQSGMLYGVVARSLINRPGSHNCDLCDDDRKGKPIVGLDIIRGLKPDGTEQWDGGTILDPENGRVYRCKITLSADGKRLDVRGYVGISLLGRTQAWERVE